MISVAPSEPTLSTSSRTTRPLSLMERDGGAAAAATGLVDLHNHLVPGVDDGAQTREEAEAGLVALAAQGVSALVTTPHFDASLCERPAAFDARMQDIDAGWAALRTIAERVEPALRLERGVELRLDSLHPDVTDARLRLGGGRFVLVEFSYLSIPPYAVRILRSILEQSVTPIVAHVERYWNLRRDLREVRAWRDLWALVQVNTGSVAGRYGREARERAFALLGQRGLVTCFATDFHGRGEPIVTEAARVLGEGAEEEWWRPLAVSNPGRILRGLDPIAVPALPLRTGLLHRLAQSLTG